MNKKSSVILFSFLFVFMVLLLSLVHAADSNNSIDEELQKIGKNLEGVRKRIESLRLQESGQTTESVPGFKVFLSKKLEKLETIEIYYQRQLKVLKKQSELNEEEKTLLESNKEGKILQLTQKPPYSLSFYDEHLNRLTEYLQNKETLAIEIKLAEKTLEKVGSKLKEVQQEVRLIKEKIKTEKDSSKTIELQQELELAQAEEELGGAIAGYQQIYHDNTQKVYNMTIVRAESFQKTVSYIAAHLFYDPTDYKNEIDNLDRYKSELQQEMSSLMKARQKAEKEWLKRQTDLERSSELDRPVAEAALKASELWRETFQKQLTYIEDIMSLLDEQKEIWKKRYELLRVQLEYEKIIQWKKDISTNLDKINKLVDLQQRYQSNIQLQVTKVYDSLSSDTMSPEIKIHLKKQFEALKMISQANYVYLAKLNLTSLLYQRLLNETLLEQRHPSLWQRLQPVFITAKDVWRFEILVIDEQSITVGKVMSALTILVLGIFLSNMVIRIIRSRILRRIKIGENAVAITEKLTYYFMLFMVVLIAMQVVNIPLTVFTFFGGALAIGIGFGAQKLLSNFISGFIIMIEQPIKVGDVIEMDNMVGVVEDIGIRCTRVRTFQSIHVLVPNSFFLENNITNWTHNSNNVRTQVTVGVAYGSPTRDVKRLLLKAVAEHNRILRNPEPFVLFNDFGDNSLVFDIYFWVTVYQVMDRKIIESDVRFIIDDLFRKAGIVIAFPQRDVHLDTTQPIQVAVVDEKN